MVQWSKQGGRTLKMNRQFCNFATTTTTSYIVALQQLQHIFHWILQKYQHRLRKNLNLKKSEPKIV